MRTKSSLSEVASSAMEEVDEEDPDRVEVDCVPRARRKEENRSFMDMLAKREIEGRVGSRSGHSFVGASVPTSKGFDMWSGEIFPVDDDSPALKQNSATSVVPRRNTYSRVSIAERVDRDGDNPWTSFATGKSEAGGQGVKNMSSSSSERSRSHSPKEGRKLSPDVSRVDSSETESETEAPNAPEEVSPRDRWLAEE